MSIDYALILDDSKTNQATVGSMLNDLGIGADMASMEGDFWSLLSARAQSYDLVIVARPALDQELRDFVFKLRSKENYVSTPLILLIGDTDKDLKYLYLAGITQVFSWEEVHLLQDYVSQCQHCDSFEKHHQNKAVIIEDDVAQQAMVRTILEDKQCECFCYSTAEEALSHVEQIEPHVIICDFFLEDKMTAQNFLLNIKQEDHPWQHVPILVMTSLDDSSNKYELVRSGADDYITKPLDALDLSVRIENLMRFKHLIDTVEKQRQEMRYLAMHDQLTGLYNRHFVAEQVSLNILEAQRHQTDYSMIFLDVDHFKQVNDKHGHDIGDEVLRAIGVFLQEQVRGHDVVARMGGEEFLMLMNHCDMLAAAEKAESIRLGLEKIKPAGLMVTASFGVAQLDKSLTSFDKLFKAADQAVHRAKEGGRNRVEIAVN